MNFPWISQFLRHLQNDCVVDLSCNFLNSAEPRNQSSRLFCNRFAADSQFGNLQLVRPVFQTANVNRFELVPPHRAIRRVTPRMLIWIGDVKSLESCKNRALTASQFILDPLRDDGFFGAIRKRPGNGKSSAQLVHQRPKKKNSVKDSTMWEQGQSDSKIRR